MISVAAAIVGSEPDDVTGVTFNGVSAVFIGKFAAAGGRFQSGYCLPAPATGTHNVVVTSATSHYIEAAVSEYTGVDQNCAPDARIIQAGSGNTFTGTITTVADNDWSFVFVLTNGMPTPFSGGSALGNGVSFGVAAPSGAPAPAQAMVVQNLTLQMGSDSLGPLVDWAGGQRHSIEQQACVGGCERWTEG